VQAGEIGRLEQVIITSRDPSPRQQPMATSACYVTAIHDFDMARYFVGDIAEVRDGAFSSTRDQRAGDIDTAMVTLRSRGAWCTSITAAAAPWLRPAAGSVWLGNVLIGNRHATTVQSFGPTSAGLRTLRAIFIERYARPIPRK
jgi:myo-inositol 2-dehydrogenase/D-chiro-inositol 1-dehydrogenase